MNTLKFGNFISGTHLKTNHLNSTPWLPKHKKITTKYPERTHHTPSLNRIRTPWNFEVYNCCWSVCNWCFSRPVTDRDDKANGEEEEDQGRFDLHEPQSRGHGWDMVKCRSIHPYIYCYGYLDTCIYIYYICCWRQCRHVKMPNQVYMQRRGGSL